LRWDKRFLDDDHKISPRVHLLYLPRERTSLRLSWGNYYQSPQLNDLQVEDGVRTFYLPQHAEQWLLCVEQRFPAGLLARIEAYDKRLHSVRPRYENLYDPVELFPESRDDRVLIDPQRGRASGIELLVRREGKARLNWWASYTLARAEDEIDGVDIPRAWDQRHAVGFGIDARLGAAWNVSLAGNYHSGWPTTSQVAVRQPDGSLALVPQRLRNARLPDYYRIDGRASRLFATRYGTAAVTAEVENLTGHANICCVDYSDVGPLREGETAEPEKHYWPRIIPFLSVRWNF
jgi:outer membrane cobalamin receptor